MALPATNRHLLIFLLLRSMNKQLNFPTIFWSFAVPRGVLKDDFDFSLELDEEHQVEPPFIIEMDEDEAQYKEAVPPAPKLQGTIPRSDGTNATTNGTQSATGDGSSATSVLIQGENSFTDGELIFSVFAFFFLRHSPANPCRRGVCLALYYRNCSHSAWREANVKVLRLMFSLCSVHCLKWSEHMERHHGGVLDIFSHLLLRVLKVY